MHDATYARRTWLGDSVGVGVWVPLAVSVWEIEALWVVDRVCVTLGVDVAVTEGVKLCQRQQVMARCHIISSIRKAHRNIGTGPEF